MVKLLPLGDKPFKSLINLETIQYLLIKNCCMVIHGYLKTKSFKFFNNLCSAFQQHSLILLRYSMRKHLVDKICSAARNEESSLYKQWSDQGRELQETVGGKGSEVKLYLFSKCIKFTITCITDTFMYFPFVSGLQNFNFIFSKFLQILQ